jgi:2,3-dihydroxybenzoate decarboxylase
MAGSEETGLQDLRVVTLEEHVATPEYPGVKGGAFTPEFARHVAERLCDVTEVRLPEMDAAGIDVQVLSLTTPGVQGESNIAVAVEWARRANDWIAEAVAAYPDRFAGFAVLPCQDPECAIEELQRCVEQLGFCGALVNGQTGGVYLDDPRFDALWVRLESLGVPLYLHPTFPPRPPAVLEGYPELAGPVWGWAFETGTHALRLVAGGVFDRHPGATVVLGHMGEGLPYALERLDDRWAILVRERPLEHPPSYYVRHNMYVTTAGAEDQAALQCAIAAMGVERVLFSVDYPYQSPASATAFIRAAAVDDAQRVAICSGNADRLLGLTSG